MLGRKSKAKPLSSPEKAEQVLLLLSDLLKESDGFGNVMLEKAVYYADQQAYLKFGKTITGLTYVRQRHGPTIQPDQFDALTKRLEAEGKIAWESKRVGRFTQHRLIALKPDSARTDSLTAEEVSVVRSIADKLFSESAKSLSKASHGLAWQIAQNMEELPPFTALVSEAPILESDVAWARRQIGAK